MSVEGGAQVIALPGVCQGCRKPVIWNGKRWRNPGQWGRRHACQPDGTVLCGAFMTQIQERCARRLGHYRGQYRSGDHSSRYAMDNRLAAKRKWRAA